MRIECRDDLRLQGGHVPLEAATMTRWKPSSWQLGLAFGLASLVVAMSDVDSLVGLAVAGFFWGWVGVLSR